MNIVFMPAKLLKKYIISNKKLYLLCFLVVMVGVLSGVYLVLGELIDDVVYASSELSLSEIILGERGMVNLFFQNFWALLLPLVIIFVLSLNKYTKFLSFFYLSYQGLLLGASIASVIMESGVAGGLNTLFIIIPINLLNFFVLVSGLIINYKRQTIAKIQRLSLGYSLKVFASAYLGLVLGMILASLIYGIVYPLLLKSVIVVNV